MSITVHDLINNIFESGVADSPAARHRLNQTLSRFAGGELAADIVMLDLLSEDAWTPAAQDRILSALRSCEGQLLIAPEPIEQRLRDVILNDTQRWNLTAEQKEQILSDRSLMQSWISEYSEKLGLGALLEYVVDDDIYAWKEQQRERPPLDQVIQSAKQKKLETDAGKRALICLTANDDRTWTAAAIQPEQVDLAGTTDPLDAGAPVPFVREQSYPVEVLYYRTDINGSGMLDSITCNDRDDLLSTLDWLGKCGFAPEQVWDFNIDTATDQRLFDIFRAGQQRRHEIAQSEMYAFLLDDDDAPMLEMPQAPKNTHKSHEPER